MLVAEGAVRRLALTRGEAARLTGTPDTEPDKPFIELWLALATPPAIGESLVDQLVFERELARFGPDDDLVLIGATGLYSFMGTEWRRSGVFDRIELIQGANTIRLAAADYTRLNALRAPGAPELRDFGKALPQPAHGPCAGGSVRCSASSQTRRVRPRQGPASDGGASMARTGECQSSAMRRSPLRRRINTSNRCTGAISSRP